MMPSNEHRAYYMMNSARSSTDTEPIYEDADVSMYQKYSDPEHYMKPRSTPAVMGKNCYRSSAELGIETPPHPYSYCNTQPSQPDSDRYRVRQQHSRPSYSLPPPPDPYEEMFRRPGMHGAMVNDTNRRLSIASQSSVASYGSVYETSPSWMRPPPPTISPPPPPSMSSLRDSESSDRDDASYLEILPQDGTMERGRQIAHARSRPNSYYSSRSQITGDTETTNQMLRWFKIISMSDQMTPSLYGLSIQEEVSAFNQRATDVKQALRLFNILMMQRNPSLQKRIAEISSIASSLEKVKRTSKKMGIAGGTTGAVGGTTAVVGIALAPMTMGISLIATAVGVSMVAAAGGMGAHAAKTNKKVVNSTTVAKLIDEYKADIVDIEQCLLFILNGMSELRRHDLGRLDRAGAHIEALQMAEQAQSVIWNNGGTTSVAHLGGMSSEAILQAFSKEIDQYFKGEDGKKLRKSYKSRFSGRLHLLAQNLKDQLEHILQLWKQVAV